MSENIPQKSPEKAYLFSDARVREFQGVVNRMSAAIHSLHENLTELEREQGQAQTPEQKNMLEVEIGRHREAIAKNEAKMKEFEEAMEFWEGVMQKSATEILEKFSPDKEKPN